MLQQTLVIIVWYQKISNNQLHGVMLEIPREKRESQNPTFLKESVHPNRNFQRDGRGGGVNQRKTSMGDMDIFKHNTV